MTTLAFVSSCWQRGGSNVAKIDLKQLKAGYRPRGGYNT